VDTGKFKLYILLYADDIVLMSETETGLHKGLDIVKDYCWRWKLFVNGNKTKIMIFKKGGINRNVMFKYNDQYLELVNTFSYLGIFFTPGGSLRGTLKNLSGAASKAIFKLKSYLIKFPDLKTSYMLDLFDKLVVPVLSYDSEIRAYTNVDVLERICLRFYKQVLGIKLQSQHIFVHGE